jgi:hypothetical protein
VGQGTHAQAGRLGPGSPGTVRGPDRTIRHGHISKQGPAWLRWILCEAAQTAKRHPQFAAGYQAIARRRGKKIATTAIARRLLTRAWHLLTAARRPAASRFHRNRHLPRRDGRAHRPGGSPRPRRARAFA